MSIQSTQTITRQTAISRIYQINALLLAQDYLGIEDVTSEHNHDIQSFVDGKAIILVNLERWTDKMLEDQMDKPFYRFSMFENYSIGS